MSSILLLWSCNNKRSIVDMITGATIGKYAETNDFFSTDPTQKLKGGFGMRVEGEVKKSDTIDIRTLYLRTVTSREVSADDTSFIGAYRYDGYSLCDILGNFGHDKATKEDFYPTVDLYVEVSNAKGETAVFSWGEIFYSAQPHSIIVAVQATRVIPGKTEEKWPLPDSIRLVVANDAFNARFISNPTKIVVKSIDVKYAIDRDIKNYDGPICLVDKKGTVLSEISELPEELGEIRYDLNTYGHGMGSKGFKTYRGKALKYLLEEVFPVSPERLQGGLFIVAAADGYRAAYSYAEIMARSDGNYTLISDNGKEKKGFLIFHPADFFVDRQIKTVNEIRLMEH